MLLSFNWQLDGEGAAFAEFRGDGDFSAVCEGEMFYDGQAQTNPAQLTRAGAVHAIESFKQTLQVLRGNSPVLHDDVRRAKLVGRLRGFTGGLGFIRQAHGPGWALVGDAGYFKDPLTAHGITDALRDAEILARAVLTGRPQSLQLYQDMRDELSRALFDITDDIASFRWSLEQAKTLHTQLSAAMRAETDYMASLSSAGTIAA